MLASCGPDWVLAQGDTTSTMVAAMSAFYRRCRFGHVEAGLRTGDRWRPFPEEANRYVADYVADLMFAPTEHSRRALLAEGHPAERILVTGNTVVDALQEVAGRPYEWEEGPLAGLPVDRPLVFLTAHRRESFGEPLREVGRAVRELAARFSRASVCVFAASESGGAGAHAGDAFGDFQREPGRAAGLPVACAFVEAVRAGADGFGGPTRGSASGWACRCWCCGRRRSGPKGWRRGWRCWWGRTGSGSWRKGAGCWGTRGRGRRWWGSRTLMGMGGQGSGWWRGWCWGRESGDLAADRSINGCLVQVQTSGPSRPALGRRG